MSPASFVLLAKGHNDKQKKLKNNSQASSVLLEMAGRIEGTSFASKLRVAGTRSQKCTVEKLEG